MGKTSTPQASVIIPAYNVADTIADQLDTLCQQVDAPEFEVIIADNGSTDNLRGAVEPFKQKLNVRVINASAKKGQSFARNLAVWEAPTNFILSCDADDIVGEHWVNRIYQHISTSDCQVATPIAVFLPASGGRPGLINILAISPLNLMFPWTIRFLPKAAPLPIVVQLLLK